MPPDSHSLLRRGERKPHLGKVREGMFAGCWLVSYCGPDDVNWSVIAPTFKEACHMVGAPKKVVSA